MKQPLVRFALLTVFIMLVVACSPANTTPTPFLGDPYMNTQVAAIKTSQAQGSGLAPLCQGRSALKSGTKLTSSTNKFIVIDTDLGTIDNNYLAAISPDERAESTEDATAVICAEFTETKVKSCDYENTDKNSGQSVLTLLRSRPDIRFSLIDVATKTLIDSSMVAGVEPDECPSLLPQDTESYTIEGKNPTSEAFLTWLQKASTKSG